MQDNTKKHQFTVVIPTRERCDTLEHSLHTCVIQDYDNLEIIVSDNYSHDRTREVVESYRDSRIRYINTGKRMSMTDNFEFALSHVKPEGYVIYIGDDDGLLPNAIRDINTVINQTGAQVLRWNMSQFEWPNAYSDNTAASILISSINSGIATLNSADVVRNVLSCKRKYSLLPMLYIVSAVSFDVIKKIINLSGRFYHSITPDVYSGFAIAGSTNVFVNSKRSYSLAGCSRYSNGESVSGRSKSYESAQNFFSENSLPYHSNLVLCRSLASCVAECFLQVNDHLSYFNNFKLDMQQLLFEMMEEAAGKHQNFYMNVQNAVLQIGKMHNIIGIAQRAIAANPKRESVSGRNLTIRNITNKGIAISRHLLSDIHKGCLRIDCSSLDIKNVYDASLLCYYILELNNMNILGFSSVVKSSLFNIRNKIIAHYCQQKEKLSIQHECSSSDKQNEF